MSYNQYRNSHLALYGYLDLINTPMGQIFTHYASTGFLMRACFNDWGV